MVSRKLKLLYKANKELIFWTDYHSEADEHLELVFEYRYIYYYLCLYFLYQLTVPFFYLYDVVTA